MAERIDIVVTAKGTQVSRREIEGIGTAAKTSSASVDFLTGAIKGMIGALTVTEIIRVADAATSLTNTLKQTGLAGEALAQTQNRLYDAAAANGQQVNALAAIYQKMTANQEALQASSAEMLDVTEGIAAAMRLSGAGTSAQAGALTQLSQAFGNPIIQAEEYNSLLDGAYPLLQAAARGMEETGGSVGKLTQLVKSGQVTNKEFFDALQIGLVETRAIAEGMPLTIGQALTSLSVRFQQLVGSVDQTTGIFRVLSAAIVWTSQNLNLVFTAVTALSAPFIYLAGAAVVGAAIKSFQSFVATIGTVSRAMVALTAVMAANPITALVVGITAGVAALIYFRSELTASSKRWQQFFSLVDQSWQLFQAAAGAAFDFFYPLVTAAIDAIGRLATWISDNLVAAVRYMWEVTKPIIDLFLEGWQKIVDIVNYLSGRAPAGAAAAGIKAAADNAATAIETAHDNGGKKAAQVVNDAHDKGGKKAATDIAKAIDTPIKAAKPVLEEAGEKIQGGIVDGGETAAAAMEKSVAMAGMQAGQSMYQQLAGLGDVWSNSLQKTIGDLIGRMINAQYNLLHSQRVLMEAEAAKFRAEAAKLNRERQLLSREARGGGSSTGDYTGIGGRGTTLGNIINYNDGVDRSGYTNYVGSFRRGGSMQVGGTGAGIDRTPVSFDAQRGERVTVETRKQQRANDNWQQLPPEVIVQIANYTDPQEMITALQSDAAKEVIINHIITERHVLANLVVR